MVWLGITRKGLGLLSKTKKAKKIKEVIRAKVVNEIFQGKKYKYAGNLWKAKQRALPENVKKRSLPPSKGPDSKGLPAILENSDYFTKLIGE